MTLIPTTYITRNCNYIEKALVHNYVDIALDTAPGYLALRGSKSANTQIFYLGATAVSYQFSPDFTTLKLWKSDATVVNLVNIIHEAL